jgi:predicted HAD superfamily hydrolase
MFGFTLWLLHWSKREALRRMLFIARDGWLPQQLFDSCKDKAGLSDVNTEYFYMSRNSSYLTGQREWDTYSTWAFVVGRVPKSPERSVRSLGLDAGDYQARAARLGVPDVKTPLCKEEEYRLKKLVDGLFARALMVCRDNREELEDYYRAAVGPAGKVGFVDIGWHGNLQRSFVHSLTDVDAMARVVGLYLGTLDASRANQAKGLKMQGWMVNLGEPWSWQEAMVNGGVELMEFLLTADHGSTLTLRRDENGVITPVLEEQGPDEVAHRDAAMRAQAGVRRFVEDYKFLLDHFRPETICSPAWAAGFERLVNRPTREEADLLGVLTHSDAPGANHDRIALARKLPWKHRFRKGGRYRRAREAAFWKAGFDARNK